jgi:PIN domain nuclease of toxin-antitoxin system
VGSRQHSGPTLEWVSKAVLASAVIVHPLEPAIAVDSAELPGFHGDPADRMIVSTARHLAAVLVTKDSKILDWAETTKGVHVLEP